MFVSFSYCLYYILLSSKYFSHRFTQGQGNTTISISAAPCDFPHQSGIRASDFRALVFENFGLLFACVKDGKYEQDDKLEWC